MLEGQGDVLDRVSIDWLRREWLNMRTCGSPRFRPIAPNTAKAYGQVPKPVRPLMAMPLSSLSMEWMQWAVAAMNEQGMMTSAINLRVKALSMMVEETRALPFALDDGAVVVVPDVRIDRRLLPYYGGRTKPERVCAEDDVIRDLLRFSRTQGDAGAVIAGMIFTGRRVEQMCSLERGQIEIMPPQHAVAAIIRWRGEQTKTDDEDVTYVPRELVTYWPGFVDVTDRRMFPCSPDLIDKRLALFSEAFGLGTKLTSHDLRRYFITKNHLRGKPLKLIADMVGQKSIATTASYIKKLPSSTVAAEAASFAADIEDMGNNTPTGRWGKEWWWKT